jgi:hypothetical protein
VRTAQKAARRTAQEQRNTPGPRGRRAPRSARFDRPVGVRLGALALGLGLAGASAGCAGPGVSIAANPVAAVREAGTVSMEVHSALVATTVTETSGGVASQYTGDGAFDFDQGIGEVNLTVPQAGTPLQEIVTPTALYMRSTSMGGKWVEVAAARLADGDLISAGYTNPVLAFALLKGVGGAGTAVRYVGQGSVRGTAVAHYAGTLDLNESAAAAQDPVRSALLAAAHAFSRPTVPFDVFLDASGRVRRIVAHYAFPATTPQKGQVQISSTTDLFDLGSPVTVSVPAARDLGADSTAANAG